jgi:hypothetical protein
MAPFLSTHWKGEFNSCLWERTEMHERIPQKELECETLSMLAAVISAGPRARTSLNKDSGPI